MQVLSTLTEIQTALQIMHLFIILGRLCSVATPWSLGLCKLLAWQPSAAQVTHSKQTNKQTNTITSEQRLQLYIYRFTYFVDQAYH